MSTALAIKSTQASRLSDLRRQSGLSQRDVAAKIVRSGLRLTSARISAYEKDETIKIKMPILRKLAEIYKTSTEFIETGKPAPITGVVDSGVLPILQLPHHHSSNAKRIPIDDIPFRVLPYLPIRVRATFAESFIDDTKYEEGDNLAVPGVPDTKEFEEAMIVEVDGDSMEPTLISGGRVLVTPVGQDDWQYMPSGIYCFVYRSTFVIKRVKDNDLLATGLLTLHSDNPNGGSYAVRGEDLRAVWRVRWGVFTPIN